MQTSANQTSWTPRRGARRRAAVLLAVAAVSAGTLLTGVIGGCNRKPDTGVQAYSAPKDTKPPVPAPDGSPGGNGAGAPTPVASADPADGGQVQWDVPEGWKKVESAERMRFATFAVTPDESGPVVTVISVSHVPLILNVNRWAGQLGLPAVEEGDLGKVTAALDTAAGKATLVDLTGPEQAGKPRQQMLAALLDTDQREWSIKLVGPADVVGAQKPKFEAFVRSIRFGQGAAEPAQASAPAAPGAGNLPPGHPELPSGQPAQPALPAGHPPIDGAGAAQGTQGPAAPAEGVAVEVVPGLAKWSTPTGWQRDTAPAAGPMAAMPGVGRSLAFKVGGAGGGGDAAVVTVIRMGPTFDILTNVNRWRGQVGLPPVEAVNGDATEPVKVGGQNGLLFNIAGQDKQMLVAVVLQNGSMWYFKMLGPAATVAGQKDAMKAFLESVQFE